MTLETRLFPNEALHKDYTSNGTPSYSIFRCVVSFICDAHVHIYSIFDIAQLLRTGARQLQSLYETERQKTPSLSAKPDHLLLLLTERSDCDYFHRLKHQETTLLTSSNFRLLPTAEPESLKIEVDGGTTITVIAGTQINTSERIELLALLTANRIADRQPLEDTLSQIRNADGIPVINWAPGKWMGKRKPLIEAQINNSTPGTLLLGDSSLRPTLWTEPVLMRNAHARGLGILAGSDPLPLPGQEKTVGSYGIISETTLRNGHEVADLRTLLSSPNPAIRRIGARRSTVAATLDIASHMRQEHHEASERC